MICILKKNHKQTTTQDIKTFCIKREANFCEELRWKAMTSGGYRGEALLHCTGELSNPRVVFSEELLVQIKDTVFYCKHVKPPLL